MPLCAGKDKGKGKGKGKQSEEKGKDKQSGEMGKTPQHAPAPYEEARPKRNGKQQSLSDTCSDVLLH